MADVPGEALRALAASGRLRATADFGVLADLDTIGICVPTPLHKTKDPDLSHVEAAVGEVARRLRPGQLVVLESTTWSGTVEEFVRPRLEAGGQRAGRDFFLAFSPERVDELAAQVNAGMPRHVVQRVADALNTRSRAINGARIHLLGVAYKPGVGDTRESPALDVAHLLLERGAAVTWSDPFVARAETRGGALPHPPTRLRTPPRFGRPG